MASTIDPAVPASHAALSSAAVRANFTAAKADIEALQAVTGGLVRTSSINTTALITDGVIVLNASSAPAGLVLTIPRTLGAASATRTFTIERDVADNSATPNPIIIQDDVGTERGRIISPVTVTVPWLAARVDGTNLVCRGIP